MASMSVTRMCSDVPASQSQLRERCARICESCFIWQTILILKLALYTSTFWYDCDQNATQNRRCTFLRSNHDTRSVSIGTRIYGETLMSDWTAKVKLWWADIIKNTKIISSICSLSTDLYRNMLLYQIYCCCDILTMWMQLNCILPEPYRANVNAMHNVMYDLYKNYYRFMFFIKCFGVLILRLMNLLK